MTSETAQAWLARWEAEAAAQAMPRDGRCYWDAAWEWIAAERINRDRR